LYYYKIEILYREVILHLKIKIPRWSDSFQFKKEMPKKIMGPGQGFYFFLGHKPESKYKAIVEEHALAYQKESFLKSERETVHFLGVNGPVWIQRRAVKKSFNHGGAFEDSEYTQARDGSGALVSVIKAHRLKHMDIEIWGATEEEEIGLIVGLDLGAYQFRPLNEGQNMLEGLPQVVILSHGKAVKEKNLKQAQAMSAAINLARHLVNLPGQDLNPKSFSQIALGYFNKSKNVKVTLWNKTRLEKEKMGLHLAVGQGSQYEPCMVHLSYRPPNKKAKKPIAIIGKGITFDTGGLDIKPSSGMRWMKKDMGGAAATFALCAWIDEVKLNVPCDFYLAIAENAVGPNSFRPGDILKARNGLTVEIHNTDAEGRLVLADVLDVAVKSKDKPRFVIDIATLTGAIKVALGADVPGLFSNDDVLANKIEKASQAAGETCWRMPLVSKYANQMTSSVAHLTNSVDGFAGAVTAALFLEKFVGNQAWAHLDIYAWNDKPMGGLSFVGGSGQGVQTLAHFLMELD